jgi:uncharacterized protein with NAD-binding domain and iron-sulfur cluster
VNWDWEMSGEEAGLPAYRERGVGYDRYALSLPGPYTQLDASMAGYAFKADGYCLQGVVNHYLAGDAEYHHFALPLVLLTLVDMQRVFLSDNPALGHMHEIDGGYQIACISVHRTTHELGITLFMPYLWVNTGTAMATGREVLGFQKDVALSFSPDDARVTSAADLTHIESWVTRSFGDKLARDFVARVHPEPAPDSGSERPPTTFARLGAGLLHLVEEALPRLSLAIGQVMPVRELVNIERLRKLFSGELAPPIRVAFVKQFRDEARGEGACYQKVFSAPAVLTNVALERFGGKRPVSIANFASHPIADELGLLAWAGPDGVYEASASFLVRFQLDMGMKPATEPARRKKVAILGGGPAGLAAMMDLSRYPERYELSLYQVGWRLGGKCASGRGFSSPLAGEHGEASWQRSHEHGLHMALGFYENFFDLLRQSYDTLNRSEAWALRSWTDALAPRNSFTLAERAWRGSRDWFDLSLHLPTNNLVPGSRARHAQASHGRPDLLRGVLRFVESLLAVAARIPLRPLESVGQKLDLGLLRGTLAQLLERGPAWLQDAGQFVASLRSELQRELLPLHEQLAAPAPLKLDTTRWPFTSELAMLEVGLRFVVGIGTLLRQGKSFDALNEIEFSAWLDGALAFPMLPWTRGSAFLRACYVLPFAYDQGNTKKPCLAAGPGARSLLRILADYAGSVAYDFRAGMGEAVIVPFYQTILRRAPDARFEFFSRVRALRAADGRITEIHIGRQATIREGRPYRPLVDVSRMECFPTRPLYEQLEQGERLRQSDELAEGGFDLESSWTEWPDVATEVLKLGRDFDEVVLAMPPPAAREVTTDLAAQSPAWASMLEHVTGVPTVAAQIWLNETLEELGWSKASGAEGAPLILGCAPPLQAAAEMSEILQHEPWRSSEPPPKSLLYLCDAMRAAPGTPAHSQPDAERIKIGRESARRQTLEWLGESLGHLLPGVLDESGRVRWSALSSPTAESGKTRLEAQYYRANISLSDLYITTFPGSCRHRLSAAPGLFDNLYLAGDWVKNNIEIGSLEGAILGGRMAARALLGMSYALYGEHDPAPWGTRAGSAARAEADA